MCLLPSSTLPGEFLQLSTKTTTRNSATCTCYTTIASRRNIASTARTTFSRATTPEAAGSSTFFFNLIICQIQIIHFFAICAATVDPKDRLVATVDEKVVSLNPCVIVKDYIGIQETAHLGIIIPTLQVIQPEEMRYFLMDGSAFGSQAVSVSEIITYSLVQLQAEGQDPAVKI